MDVLTIPHQRLIYIILDALNGCPNTSVNPSPREQVLALLKQIALPHLHICVTSHPEFDMQNTFNRLASHHVSLDYESRQKQDLVNCVRFVVYSDKRMKRWREDDKKAVVKALSDKAGGA